jgi:hypothetical protein
MRLDVFRQWLTPTGLPLPQPASKGCWRGEPSVKINNQLCSECNKCNDSLNDFELPIPVRPYRITFSANANTVSAREVDLLMSVLDKLLIIMAAEKENAVTLDKSD